MPLLPIRMTPAYRFGADTPWGGDRLAALFGKPIPDPRTGEALEISAIDGLCSRDENGVPLSELIARYGRELTGLEPGTPFPLLLKLLCAREPLSVQVHPDDAYAAREGKLGKTEAWVILEAEPGAELVYGVHPGVTRDMLQSAAERGAALGELLRRVPVKAGDVFPIPAGMVHAIGAGITLYEIQQSSDITYRFYDWDRVDARGQRRPLHIRQALDVVDPSLQLNPARPLAVEQEAGGVCETMLSGDRFTLCRLTLNGRMAVPRKPGLFAFLTVLHALSLNGEMLPAGQSVLIPASCGPCMLSGAGSALVAWA